MSTFKGIIQEFPQIRIDYFRYQPDHKAPLACFLSHVHSDHLTGLESLRAPFVYCSAATREILLRLEKFHHRINFARGILESRNVTYDRSMHKLAKPLPLDAPTLIELAPGSSIRVTLIDANHCVGAVMFLIEGDGKAVLYTGDIRAEAWWINSLVQNPVLLPYTLGPLRLDCIYLDTTFATKSEPCREFPSKAEGIRELLEKVSQYPEDTVFYFHSWTFGYENVWVALSAFLRSRIHVDDYRTRIYASLSTLEKKYLRESGLNARTDNKFLRDSGLEIRESPALCGFKNGNHIQPGCLTSQSNVRIHSCERGTGCPAVDRDIDAKIVHIIPIVTRANGTEIAEIGAGSGKGDLDQKEVLETGDVADVGKLMELCTKTIRDEELLSKVLALLQQALNGGDGKIDLGIDLLKESQESEDEMSIDSLISVLSSHVSRSQSSEERLHRTIRFPYSRHSSYSELCNLLNAFRPKDVYPCTVNEEQWTPSMTMRSLFGTYCPKINFRHDLEMMRQFESRIERQRKKRDVSEIQEETQSSEGNAVSPDSYKRPRLDEKADFIGFVTPVESPKQAQATSTRERNIEVPVTSLITDATSAASNPASNPETATILKTKRGHPVTDSHLVLPIRTTSEPSSVAPISTPLTETLYTIKAPKSKSRMTNRQIAYEAALGIRLTWADYGGLVSTRKKADREEEEQEL